MSPRQKALHFVILHLPHCTSVTKSMTLANAKASAAVTAGQLYDLSKDIAISQSVIQAVERAADFVKVIEEIKTVTVEDIKNAYPLSYNLL
ncbi:MAG: hypothetical protein WCH59_09225 [Chitinophagia bacterium]|jgi:hypothetical protein